MLVTADFDGMQAPNRHWTILIVKKLSAAVETAKGLIGDSGVTNSLLHHSSRLALPDSEIANLLIIMEISTADSGAK